MLDWHLDFVFKKIFKYFCYRNFKEEKSFYKKNIKSYSDLRFLKKEIDLIYSDQTLEHLSKPRKILNELIKLLKKNGILIIKYHQVHLLKKLKKNYYAQNDEAIPLEHINIFTNNSINYMKFFIN